MPTKLNSLSQLRGVSDKRACLVATVGNIAFTGITQIDGVTLSNDDRVLVWQQSISSENGIYVLSGSTNLVRTVDSKNVSDFTQGTQYFVVSGNTYSETLFYLKNKVTTLGIDDIIIDIFGGLNGTSGVSGTSGTSGSNAGITSYTNPADNRVITSVSATEINAEANLTFDGSVFDVNTTAAFKLPVGTTEQRPVSPIMGYIRYNTTTSNLEIYIDTWRNLYDLRPLVVEYLVVAGGGGAGSHVGGGGGGGGFKTSSLSNLLTGTNYTITVGAGGSGGLSDSRGLNGSNSIFATITSTGGGGGGTWAGAGNPNGINGGSGGGAGSGNGTTTGTGGSGVIGEGNSGGSTGARSGTNASGAGGGGAGASGLNRTDSSNTTKLNGAAGLSTSILGTTYFFAGGGGSGAYDTVPGGDGGTGGGGGGASSTSSGGVGSTTSINIATNGAVGSGALGGSGASNSGGGGGGGSGGTAGRGGAGGSGIVVLKYPSAWNVYVSGGLSYTTDTNSFFGFKVTRFTAGTGNIQFN